jgi:hypothetical protein
MVEKGKGPWQKKYCYEKFLNVFLGGEMMKIRQDKRMVKLEIFLKPHVLDIY